MTRLANYAMSWAELETFALAVEAETDVTAHIHSDEMGLYIEVSAYDRSNGRTATLGRSWRWEAVPALDMLDECMYVLRRVLKAREDERARYVPRGTS